MKDNTKRDNKKTRAILILYDVECLKEGNMNQVKGSKKCLIVVIKVTLTSECPVSHKVLARAIFRNVYIDVYI